MIGFVFFLIWELTEEHPVVDLRLFARRNFTMGAITMSIAYGVFFGSVVLLPLWLQTQMGYTATEAGFVLAPVGLLAHPDVADRRARGVARRSAHHRERARSCCSRW